MAGADQAVSVDISKLSSMEREGSDINNADNREYALDDAEFESFSFRNNDGNKMESADSLKKIIRGIV